MVGQYSTPISDGYSERRTLRIHIKRLFPCDRMCPHDWVYALARLPPHNTAFRFGCFSLLNARMHGTQAMQSLSKGWAQSSVGLDSINEECISTGGRLVKDVQNRCSRRLVLIGDITVPDKARSSLSKNILCGWIIRASVHQVDFRMALWTPARMMNMKSPKIPSKFNGLLNWQICEILITESKYLALSGEQGDLISSGLVQLA